MTLSHQPVMELIRASMTELHIPRVSRAESPACRVVVEAANSDISEGGRSSGQTFSET
ncbi:hypothetical protein [Streptomyces sp. NPDC002785]|uniref:hypothetical protein n=1 Tax=Streptomyces sp. NPDC002785 TaxID=3154543 RepID=UPI003316E8E7